MPAAARLDAWLQAQDGEAFDSATLINNAAMLTQLGPLEEADAAELSSALRVGLEAPLLLTAAFLRATRAWRARRLGACKVLNISSGLGRHAMASQASYCAVKAGLDHFSRSVALDQAARSTPGAHRLARAGRDRHRHADAVARRRPGTLSRPRALRAVQGGRTTRHPGRGRRQGACLPARGPTSASKPVADVRDA